MKAGFYVDTKDCDGNTPLHVAKNELMAAVLIAFGTDPNVENELGLSPLILAKDAGTAMILLVNGAKVNATTGKGLDAIHFAKNSCVASVLLGFGADPNEKTRATAKTPLFFARSVNICEVLVDNGAEVDARDSRGRTAIMEMFAKLSVGNEQQNVGTKHMIEYLAMRGASLDMVDKEGKSVGDVIDDEEHKIFLRDVRVRVQLLRMKEVVVEKGLNEKAIKARDVVTETLRLCEAFCDLICSFV